MSLNDQDARALAYLARRLREETRGANTWDERGALSVISKLAGQDLAIIAERVIRHSCDTNAETPGAITRPFVPAAPSEGPPRAPRPDEACRICGRFLHAPDAICDTPARRPAPKPDDVTSRVAALRHNVAPLRPARTNPNGDPT